MSLSGRRDGRFRLGCVVASTIIATAISTPVSAAPTTGEIVHAGGATAVADSYVVVLNDAAVSRVGVDSRVHALAVRHGGTVGHVYRHALRGFEVRLSPDAARRLAADPSVRYVEQNHTIRKSAIQTPTPSWGLDRIDQRSLPLNTSYVYPTTAANVRAYVIDTGVRMTHQAFGGRVVSGRDTIDRDDDATDCDGHGTHVAGILGSSLFGVAKSVQLVAVRVLDCTGSATYGEVIAGVDWVTADHDPGEPAVANMSLGGNISQAVNDAVAASIADGVTYAVAAGNEDSDACRVSPASTPAAITVGATEITDARAFYSNVGTCLDVFGPGTDITSTWLTTDTATNTITGTSMASPHAAGVAALILSADPSLTPQQVRDRMVADATTGVIPNPGEGSPNRLLFVDNTGTPGDDFSLSLSRESASLPAGGSVSTTVRTATVAGAPQVVTLSASGLPPGVTATFDPPAVTSGGSSTLTIDTSTLTEAGSYTLVVTGVAPSATQAKTFGLNIVFPPGCVAGNAGDVHIPDGSTVESTITVSGCSGQPSATSAVQVHIVHPYQPDLIVRLIAPDGTAYLLHNLNGGGVENLDHAYTLNLSNRPANGIWRLVVHDEQGLDTGFIDSWSLNLRPPTPTCRATNPTNVPFPVYRTGESPITISGCAGKASAGSRVEVHLVHRQIGDLQVSLVAPDGSSYYLHNRTGGRQDNINRTYVVSLPTEMANGTWRLRVRNAIARYDGYIDSWTLTV